MKYRIGSHVGMSGKEMMLGSAKEAVSYEANTFMLYTGAPQNTRRKPIEELNIKAAWDYMRQNDIDDFMVHAPYIINLANSVKSDTFTLAVDFLALELERTIAMGSHLLILHPGAHVGAGTDAGIRRLTEGLNAVLTKDTDCLVALETMSGKGSEIGRSFEELAAIYDGTSCQDKLRVCFDTCHVHDAGYPLADDFDGVIERFNRVLSQKEIAAFHINDSKNECGASKDRHANIGHGHIGLSALRYIVNHPSFSQIPKILETPWISAPNDSGKTVAPYLEEIKLLLNDSDGQ